MKLAALETTHALYPE